jgi:hypothetical protein
VPSSSMTATGPRPKRLISQRIPLIGVDRKD